MSAQERGLDATVKSLDDAVPIDDSVPTVIIVSNFGTGEPPDNAKAFFRWLTAGKSDPATRRDQLRFAVFGLGNKEYGGMYQHTGRVIDDRLAELGATRLVPRGEGDSSRGHDPEDDFERWLPACLDALEHVLPKTDTTAVATADDVEPTIASAAFDLVPLARMATSAAVVKTGVVFDLPRARPVHPAPANPTPSLPPLASATRPMLARVVEHRELHGLTSPRSCSHLAFRVGEPGPAFGDASSGDTVRFEFETGDYIGVYPENNGEDVENALSGFRHCRDVESNYAPAVMAASALVVAQGPSAAAIAASHARYPATVDTVLRYFVDLSRPAPRRLLRLLSSHAATERERATLEALIDLARPRRDTTGDQSADSHAASTAGVLSRVSHSLLARLSVGELLSHANPLAARFYSITSASSAHPNEAWLACGRTVHWDAQRMTSFVGCSSRSLARLRPGDSALVFPVPSDFRLTKLAADSQPIVMIANGTGLAPFRGFIEERRARRASAPSVLLYGCMYADQDFLYRDDIETWHNEGACELHAVFSHQDAERRGGALQFVQHHLVLGDPIGERVWSLVHEHNAPIFVCGTPALGVGIVAAINALAVAKGVTLPGNTMTYVEHLQKQRRFNRDVFK